MESSRAFRLVSQGGKSAGAGSVWRDGSVTFRQVGPHARLEFESETELREHADELGLEVEWIDV